MIVVGVDPATYELGLAAVRVENGTMSLVDAKHISVDDKKELMPRLEYIFYEAHEFYKRNEPDCIVIESQYLHNARAMRIIAYSVGVLAVAGLLAKPSIPIEIIEAKKWRKVAFGDGNLSKDQVVRMTKEQFGLDVDITTDVAEAIGIAMAGAKLRA